MTDLTGDPTTLPFWEGAVRGEFLLQRCEACASHQFYPRPFCLSCGSDALVWTATAGLGTVYSRTVVHIEVRPGLEPPYAVLLVELDEGPRVLGRFQGPGGAIDERVRMVWLEPENNRPLWAFETEESK